MRAQPLKNPLKSTFSSRHGEDNKDIGDLWKNGVRNAKTKIDLFHYRVFELQCALYGMSVGGGVSENHLPVFVTFFHKF